MRRNGRLCQLPVPWLHDRGYACSSLRTNRRGHLHLQTHDMQPAFSLAASDPPICAQLKLPTASHHLHCRIAL